MDQSKCCDHGPEFYCGTCRPTTTLQSKQAFEADQCCGTKIAEEIPFIDRLKRRALDLDYLISIEEARLRAITQDKQFRKQLDESLQQLKNSPRRSPEREESIKNLKLAIMWLGMDLKELGTPTPYPNSYDPSNTKVDPSEVKL